MAPLPAQMKAVQINGNGGVEVLKLTDVPVPSPAEGQILVKNEYAGINFIDTYFRGGLYPSPHFPLTLGREGGGEVVAVHSSVKDIKPGQKVVYLCDASSGAYSEYTAAPIEKVMVIPDGVEVKAATASLTQGLTAITMIHVAPGIQRGQWALVHAAAGGVGSLLVQMLRDVGAKVIASASTQEKLDLAKKYGADHTFLSGDLKEVAAKVKEITGGHGVDVIFDGVGKATFQADLEMVAPLGWIASYGNASGAVDPVNILKLGPKNVKLMRPVLYGMIDKREDFVRHTETLFDLIKNGKLEVAVHNVYPLADVAKAHTDLESRKTTGKLLLRCA